MYVCINLASTLKYTVEIVLFHSIRDEIGREEGPLRQERILHERLRGGLPCLKRLRGSSSPQQFSKFRIFAREGRSCACAHMFLCVRACVRARAKPPAYVRGQSFLMLLFCFPCPPHLRSAHEHTSARANARTHTISNQFVNALQPAGLGCARACAHACYTCPVPAGSSLRTMSYTWKRKRESGTSAAVRLTLLTIAQPARWLV
jgi:hypothetical protein